ncbi:MarR family winged helix-turn-helix transcriptional regulator [Vibrio campbellii]|uniref:MarR family winged helix-turn-helix transcriptional regulator n=1 Tax=Vibrio campbellii TaxID=680 RepID=UPI002108CD6E|nr:MarR family transcriptional regulator [Vibrio campbellii]UTZ43772.1 MarR family transcriptional regulator [Vibrio campbellii]
MSEQFERQDNFGWMINVVANDAAKRLDAEFKKHGLTIALWPTMVCLWEEEGVTQRDIAAKSKVEDSTTTRTLDKLEKLGLVERHPHPKCRRSFHIYLTEEGRSLKETLLPIPLAVNKELMSPLEPAEQKEMLRLLNKLVAEI